MEKFFRPLVRFIERFYWLILLLGLASAGVCLPRVIHLFKNISTDFIDLLPQDMPSVQSLLKVRDKLQPKRRVFILFESDNPEAVQKNLDAMAAHLKDDPFVGKIYTRKEGYDFFKNHQLFYLPVPDLEEIRDKIDRKIQQEKLGGLYVSLDDDDKEFDLQALKDKYLKGHGIDDAGADYFVSPNGKIYGMLIESKQANLNLAQEKTFQQDIKDKMATFKPVADDPTMKILFWGSSRAQEYRALMRDLQVAGAISGILIFLPLLIRFRRPSYVLGVFFPLAVGIPISLALASLWIQKLSVTTSFLFAILGGLGVETGIHLLSRYLESRRGGKSVEDSLLDLYTSMGGAVLTSVSTLAVTFLLMIFGKFRGFSEFGFISGVGLYVLFIIYFTVFPAGLVLMEKLGRFKKVEGKPEKQRKIPFTPGFIRLTLGICTALTILSIFAVPKLKFEYDTRKIRADNPADRSAKVKQEAVGFPRLTPAVVIIDNERQSEALEAAIDRMKEKRKDTIADVSRSIYNLVPKDQDKKMEVIDQMIRILSDDALDLVKGQHKKDLETFKDVLQQHHPFVLADVPPEIQKHFRGNDGGPESFFMIYKKPQYDLDNGLNAIRFAEEVQDIKTPVGHFTATSDSIVFADVLRTMFSDSRLILVISTLSIVFFVYLNFRNVKQTALIAFSIFSGVLWVMGIMYLLGLRLNLYNMVMIPAIMGMSIDNSIHIVHRYEELGPGSLSEVMGTAGLSSMLASLTNAAGFIGLVFCTHGGLRSMGMIVLLGLGTCLVTTLIYLPMILEFLEKRRAKVAVPA